MTSVFISFLSLSICLLLISCSNLDSSLKIRRKRHSLEQHDHFEHFFYIFIPHFYLPKLLCAHKIETTTVSDGFVRVLFPPLIWNLEDFTEKLLNISRNQSISPTNITKWWYCAHCVVISNENSIQIFIYHIVRSFECNEIFQRKTVSSKWPQSSVWMQLADAVRLQYACSWYVQCKLRKIS